MNQTNKIILIVVETTKNANTDGLYISKAIQHLYNIGNEIKIHYEYLTSKTKYGDKGIIKKINKDVKNFSESYIIYCLDTDNINSNHAQIEINSQIKQFCHEKGYEIIWFCRDIEEVFLHKRINDTQKVAEAKRFGSRNGIGRATVSTLSCEPNNNKKSNFIKVLDKYLERK